MCSTSQDTRRGPSCTPAESSATAGTRRTDSTRVRTRRSTGRVPEQRRATSRLSASRRESLGRPRASAYARPRTVSSTAASRGLAAASAAAKPASRRPDTKTWCIASLEAAMVSSHVSSLTAVPTSRSSGRGRSRRSREQHHRDHRLAPTGPGDSRPDTETRLPAACTAAGCRSGPRTRGGGSNDVDAPATRTRDENGQRDSGADGRPHPTDGAAVRHVEGANATGADACSQRAPLRRLVERRGD